MGIKWSYDEFWASKLKKKSKTIQNRPEFRDQNNRNSPDTLE